jgi:acyl-CoA thioester hydrolase
MNDRSPSAVAFPIRLEIPVAWGEMDAMGHVNNIVYLRWFECARIAYFERLGWLAMLRAEGVGPILHSTQARFRAPVVWPDTITVGARIAPFEAGVAEPDRFTMFYEVRSQALERVAADGSGVVVSYDYRRGAKTPLPAGIRAQIAELERWTVT